MRKYPDTSRHSQTSTKLKASVARELTVEQALARAKKAAKRGNRALAAQLFSAVLARQPNHPVARKGLRKLGRSAAEPATEQPGQADIDAVIGLLEAGRLQEAERDSRALLDRYPKSVLVLNLLGVVLQRLDKSDEAVSVLDQATRLAPGFAEAHDNRGIALKASGDFERAIESFDRAIAAKPDFAAAHYNRANALKDAGRFEKAADGYRAAIHLRPGFAEAHRNLAALKRFAAGDEQLKLMRELFDGRTGGLTNRAELCFALAKATEDLGDYDDSFRYIEEGNRLVNNRFGYRLDADKKLFSQLRTLFGDNTSTGDMPQAETPAHRPVFIVGMVRSGTSLVEQILASHKDVHGAGELEAMNRIVVPLLADHPEPAAGIDAIRTGYIAELESLGVQERVITDKMPPNFRWIGFIASALPEAKIVHVFRDPMATCWSIYRHYFPDEGHGYAYDIDNLASYYGLYDGLMRFWHERFPGRIYDLGYEALTEDLEAETRRLLDVCELDWDPACLEFHETERPVRTLSATQVRQKIYTGSSEAWRRYERHLDDLEAALGDFINP